MNFDFIFTNYQQEIQEILMARKKRSPPQIVANFSNKYDYEKK